MNWPPIMTALITPYNEIGQIDTLKAAALAQHLWGQGSGGFVVAGSTGEAFSLSIEERERLFRAVREALPKDVPVWVGTGTNDTRDTARITEAADRWGADGMLVVAPYYNRPSAAGLVAHFSEAARHTDRPLMIYDVPGRTGVHVEADVVIESARQAPNIVAVKEAAGTITTMIQMHRALPPHIKLYSGDDALLLPSLAVGAIGVVSVASHVAAAHMATLIQLYHAGNHREALLYHEAFWPLANALFIESNPVPLKWLLNQLGWSVGGVRTPLVMENDARFQGLMQSYQRLMSWHCSLQA